MSKHTPGPWQYANNGYYFTIRPVNNRSGKPGFFASFADVHAGAEYQYDYAPTPEEAKANALLISAAPEMYEALKDILSGWKYIRMAHGDLPGVGWNRAQKAAESAISKAEGGD